MGRVRWDERGAKSGRTSAGATTALAHNAQPSVHKRSAWRAWFDLRMYEHTFGLEESPSAEIGRRRTSETHGCHTASRHALSPETENCWCKLLLHQDGILRRGNCTANSCRRHNRVVCRPFNLLSLLLFSCVRRCSRRLIRLNLSPFLFLFHRHGTGNQPVRLLVTAQWLLGVVLVLGLLMDKTATDSAAASASPAASSGSASASAMPTQAPNTQAEETCVAENGPLASSVIDV